VVGSRVRVRVRVRVRCGRGVNGRGSQKQTAGCSRRRGRISVELDVAMGRQQARNEQAVHYYVGLARDPGRRALGSPEFWARSAKGLPCAGGGLRATASRLPGCMSHVARRAGSTRGSRSTGQAPECRVPVLCRPMAQGPRPTAHWGSVSLEGIIVGTTHSVTTFFASTAPTIQWSRDTACLLLSRGSLPL
jgi:hypothetical protein